MKHLRQEILLNFKNEFQAWFIPSGKDMGNSGSLDIYFISKL